MKITCSHCGTVDFSIREKSFQMALGCPSCHLVMCVACAGREKVDHDIEAFCCYRCRSKSLFSIDPVDDQIDWPPAK